MHLDKILFSLLILKKNTHSTDFLTENKPKVCNSFIYKKKKETDNNGYAGQCWGITNISTCSNLIRLDWYKI